MNQPPQTQEPPGTQSAMTPRPDCGEESYRGTGRLTGKTAVITGADSGIGRAVAIAYAREGADVLISYLSEDEDAQDTARLVREAGRTAVLVPGDISSAQQCREVVDRAVSEFGHIDILVSNAAYQMTHESLGEISDEEWEHTFATNVSAFFYLVKAALPHMPSGGSIIGSSSVNSDMPSPTLAPYAATKAAIANFCASLAQLLGPQGIRVNSVAPGPVWTPLIPATMPEEKVAEFGADTPLGRAGQPAELAPVYVLLASDEASYVSGARVAVTGGRPVL
jgi:NAD(P)-dependent dehydrogenase (short-subunit alcohol dehydrogenase family)